MSANLLMNSLNELGKAIKCEANQAFYRSFVASLLDLIIQEHEC